MTVAPDRTWSYWPLVPIYPYGQRPTILREVVPGGVWVLEQAQGIFHVVVPIRMTVIRLRRGGLLVYAPLAPTGECVGLIRSLEAHHGPVQHIIHGTLSGLEHKAWVGLFARQFPEAQVWVAPDQWSFPVSLPLSWLGFPLGRTRLLPPQAWETPFGDEVDYAILGPLQLGIGKFGEVALFHRASQTLLVTDTLVRLPMEPPAVMNLDPYPMLFHSRQDHREWVVDTPENRRKGWQRIALFIFFFQPEVLGTVPLGRSLREAKEAPDRSRRAYGGLYPFRWRGDWQEAFWRLQGRPLVAPILQTLILNRDPQQVAAWVDRVGQWPFVRCIPAHLDAPFSLTAEEWRRAFAFLGDPDADFAAIDLALLRDLSRGFQRLKILPPVRSLAKTPSPP